MMAGQVVAATWFIATALAGVLAPGVSAAGDPAKGHDNVIWTVDAGYGYPLMVSASLGGIAPLAKRVEGSRYGFPGVPALHANMDIGAGGDMVSGGLAFPATLGSSEGAVVVKAATLRTWLSDFQSDRRRYTGGVVEWLFPARHPGGREGLGKLGLGYFRDKGSTQLRSDGFVFLYINIFGIVL